MRLLTLLHRLLSPEGGTTAVPSFPDKSAELYQLAYSEAVRRLQGQETSVDELRTRAGTIVAAATIVTSFLGARFVDSGATPSVLVWIALGAFVLCVALALTCLIPLAGWRWYFGTRNLIRDYIEGSETLSLAEAQRDLALHLEDNYDHNARKLGRLYWVFVGSELALFIEVIAWLADLAGFCQ